MRRWVWDRQVGVEFVSKSGQQERAGAAQAEANAALEECQRAQDECQRVKDECQRVKDEYQRFGRCMLCSHIDTRNSPFATYA
eukprot:1400736-Amphidinium_carterae.1